MRKSDDDLKIDITELFGGDLEPARQAAERTQAAEVPGAAAGEGAPEAEAAPALPDQQYLDWISARERELESKTQELEKRLQDLLEQKLQAAQDAAPPPASPPPAAEEPPLPGTPPPDEEGMAIDFSQPIRPPFLPDAIPAVPAAVEAAAEAPGKDEEALKRAQREFEFLLLYDEFRNIIVHELRDLVGERKTFKMLERTVELAREKYPEIFRNANWDAAGNLLQDGSLDSQRLVENKSALASGKADQVFDAGLGALLSLRLQAVEKGLGTGMKNKVRARLYQWIHEKSEKAVQAGRPVEELNRLKAFVV